MEKIIVSGTGFETKSGKQIIMNGINVVCKSPDMGYTFPDLEKSFRAFQERGFNLIRYGFFWDGAEPEPGIYDRKYLQRVKEIIRMAERYELYVLLDMHQDLFSRKYADGAPLWATLDEGAYHPENCTMWYEAYLQSDAIIRAADNFWANKPARDGAGLLEHYASMWEEIARTFADCDNVIGFEPMNEPFMGSVARNAFGFAAMKAKEKNPAFDLANPETISPQEQMEFLSAVSQQLMEFDRTTLMDFYRRMQRAITKYSDKPIVTGGNIYCSSNMHSGISRLNLEDGKQIYAPHGYDSVVDSTRYEAFSKQNIELLFQDKRGSQEEMGLPVIVGEWGAFPSAYFTNDLIDHMNGILEKYLWSSAYWDYRPGMEDDANYNALYRAYPQEVCGTLRGYHYDREKQSLTVEWNAEAGETRLYCPFQSINLTASCDGIRKELPHRLEPSGTYGSLVYVQAASPCELTIEISKAQGEELI